MTDTMVLAPAVRLIWRTFALAVAVFAVYMVAEQPRLNAPTVLAGSIAVTIAAVCWRVSLCRVEVSGRGISISNPLRTHRVPWADFPRVEERIWFSTQPDASWFGTAADRSCSSPSA